MSRMSIRVLPVLIFLLVPISNSEEEEVKQSLVRFMDNLSAENARRDQSWGWNLTSDPCKDKWRGVSCDSQSQSIRKIVLDDLNLTGVLDASVCTAKSLAVLSLNRNNISGLISEAIANCKRLTHLYLSGNHFSGDLPDSLSQLSNLKRLDISNNNFSGELPDLSPVSGLISFLAQNNQLSGDIWSFDFSNLLQFNVSNNKLSGPIPDVKGRFSADSFIGNAGLCGGPLSNACPPSTPSMGKSKDSSSSGKQVLMYSGYGLLGLIIVLFIVFKFVRRKKSTKEGIAVMQRRADSDTTTDKPSTTTSSEFKTHGNKSEYSITSVENGSAASLVLLTSPLVKGLKFEDLLRAPAELLGKGKYGSLYKVTLDNRVTLAVKRIKDWSIKSEDFKSRMQRLDEVRHPNVLPALALYCSKQEKLLVYKYQPNGSLFSLLHGSQNGQVFDWGSRLNVAARVAEALAFMYGELQADGIAHGNLKSTNILFNENMDPWVSEYGLTVAEDGEESFLSQSNSFKINDVNEVQKLHGTFRADIYDFGLILLELLTGKLVQNNGFDLGRWVHSVVREEWTVEVFDRALISEGASEERMVNLLQLALKCINPIPNERPTINQVTTMINTLKEEEEISIISEP